MIDWSEIYTRVMLDFKGKRLLPHLALWSVVVGVGLFLGIIYQQNITITVMMFLMGAIIEYLFFGAELIELFTLQKPYVIEGIILQRIKKIILEDDKEIEKYFFLIEVDEAFTLSKQGADSMDYIDREGRHRFEIPESMFLSLKVGAEVALVCTPKDKVWGIIREEDEEVICIEE